MPDPFPHLHPRPATGWVNDPNGVGFRDGRWHLMFQWNPDAPVHGNIHWGHLSSADLLQWDDEGVALAPRPGTIDAGGVWSGVASVDDSGAPQLVYSAIRTGAMDSGVAVARRPATGDFVPGDAWVAPHPDGFVDVRDPFRVTLGGDRSGVDLWIQGAGVGERTGAVLAYDASDAGNWRLLGPLLTAEEIPDGLPRNGHIWECPQLFRIGEDWALIVSWLDRLPDREVFGVTAYVGDLDLDGESPRFRVRAGALLDEGPDFYAPQGFLAPDGRILLFGWSWEGRGSGVLSRSPEDVTASGWAGTLTFPRELTVHDERAVTRPAAELLALRGATLPHAATGLETQEGAFEVLAEGETVLDLLDDDGSHRVWSGNSGSVRILVDASVVEVFTTGGSATLRAYPGPGARWVLTTGRCTGAFGLRL